MKLIVGLGNPGNRYEQTRHNAGFMVVDRLMDRNGLQLNEQKFEADYRVWHHSNEKVLIAKPYTYMNNSGGAVLSLMSYYGVALEDLLVIYDEMDLDPGRIRLRLRGSAGGHNGMKSIIHLIGTDDFKRIRIGIGRPQPGWKVVDHVLAPFDKQSQLLVDQAVDQASMAIEKWLGGNRFEEIMNQFNQK